MRQVLHEISGEVTMRMPILLAVAICLLVCPLSWGAEMPTGRGLLDKFERGGIKCRSVSSDTNGCLTVDLSGSNIRDLAVLKGLPITALSLRETEVVDFSPLAGMLLTNLDLGCTQVTNLTALQGMPLRSLNLELTPVTAIEPLRMLPLTVVVLRETNIRSLRPLTNSPLRTLDIVRTSVDDLTPLKGMSLEVLRFSPERITLGIEVLRGMRTLKYIGNLYETIPAEMFWRRYDKGQFRTGHEEPTLTPSQLDTLERLRIEGGLKDDH